MTQRDRDRLVVLKKAQKRLIAQPQAASELGMSVRQVQRLLVKLREVGDRAVTHGLRGRRSKRRLSEETREMAVQILSQKVYRGFGSTLAAEYQAKRHKLKIGRETLRQVMIQAGLWRAHRQKVEQVHVWRPQRSCRGELVQWDTSEHDWLILLNLSATPQNPSFDLAKQGFASAEAKRLLRNAASAPDGALKGVHLENLERHQEAEAVLERGIAAYPYSGQLVARLAQQYFHDGQTWRASVVVHQYRKLFPEDPTVREVLKEKESSGNAGELSDPRSWNAPVGPPQ